MVLLFQPYLETKIWGGSFLANLYQTNKKKLIGEAFLLSTQKHKNSICLTPPYKNYSLAYLYQNHPQLFGNRQINYPHLIKIIHAQAHLSLQVHPNDFYAQNNHHVQYGKNECWYFLTPPFLQHVILGFKSLQPFVFNAKTAWMQQVCYHRVQKHSFCYIRAGLVHALLAGSLVIEIQQACDLTYRLYDYDRNRPLHYFHAQKVVFWPNVYTPTNPYQNILLANAFFYIKQIKAPFYYIGRKFKYVELISLEANGLVNQQRVNFGYGAIVTCKDNFQIKRGRFLAVFNF